MALNVGSRLGHYDVTALIGQGGMGQVYQARDKSVVEEVEVVATSYAVSLLAATLRVGGLHSPAPYVVMVAGAFWFVQRVFFSGGMA